MAENFSVKVNLEEGSVEIVGTDKAWVTEQWEKAAELLGNGNESKNTEKATSDDPPKTKKDAGKGSGGKRRARGKAKNDPTVAAALTGDAKTKLTKYLEDRHFETRKQTEKVAIIAAFLMDEAEIPSVNADAIYTVFKTMGLESPANPTSALDNSINREKFFQGWENGSTTLSTKGENFGRVGALKAAVKK